MYKETPVPTPKKLGQRAILTNIRINCSLAPIYFTMVQAAQHTLSEFREIAQERYQSMKTSPPGSSIDQKFDGIFEEFLRTADQVESLLQKSIRNDLQSFLKISLFLVLFSVIASVTIGLTLFRMENQRSQQLSTIQTAHAELNFMAHFDALTQLPNRTLFLDRLDQAIGHAKRKTACVALLFIDLDKFKAINDRLGHPVGDQVLHITAQRLLSSVRTDDTVARLAGDEFTIILSDISTREAATNAAKTVAENIVRELEVPFGINGSTAFLSSSIGIAIYPEDGETSDELLINADRAMFEAKSRRDDGFHFHSRELNKRAQRLLQIESELRDAIEQDQLTVHYQPQWDIQNGHLAGMEALVRWNHPRDGLIYPGEFIEVAESTGLIDKIDTWVLETACRQYREWKQEGFLPGRLSVNLSPVLFRRPDLIRFISANVAENCVGIGELELELTETALLEDTKHTQNLLSQFRSQGIQLAIDDFGTGYSSMAYLRKFPADTLKIDRSFVQVIHEDKAANAILKNMVELAGSLGMRVVAEGIETRAQEQFIRSLGCQFAQGFRLAKPMPAQDFRLLMIAQSENNVSPIGTPGEAN